MLNPGINRDILRRLAAGVRKRGRIILDLWNPEFFIAHQGERELSTPRGVVREKKRVDNDRLFVELNYPDGTHEQFEWELFTPAQMNELAESVVEQFAIRQPSQFIHQRQLFHPVQSKFPPSIKYCLCQSPVAV